MPKSPINFLVSGLEPAHDPMWATAGRDQKATYLRAVRVLVLAAFDRQLVAGIDAAGRKLKPIKQSTRMHRRSAMGPADPKAPPLTPAHELSRTRSLVDARIEGTAVRVFWKFDPVSGKRWGTILGYHRDGKGHLPARNVFGLSPAAHAAVVQEARRWWLSYSRGLKVSMPTRPRPGKAARPAMAVLPMPPTRAVPEPTAASPNLMVGGKVLTVAGGSATAAELMAAIKAGTFTGGKSYARAQ